MIELLFKGHQPAMQNHQLPKAYDRAVEMRSRVENIAAMAFEPGNQDGLD